MSELTKKSDESTAKAENSDQQQSSETVASETIKPTESSKNESDLEGTSQQKGGSSESNQQEFSQEKKDPSKSSQQSPSATKPRQESLKYMEPDRARKRRIVEPKARKVKVTDSMRQIVIWTMTGFFDFNPRYFLQVRGLMNVLHIILSLTDVIMLGLICQLQINALEPSEGFFCQPAETFLFIAVCSSLLTSVLYLISCVLSKSTDILLFQSSFEVSYFVLYFLLLLTASLTLIVSQLNWGSNDEVYPNAYESSQTAAIVGLVNSIAYGISAIWFYLSHRLYENDEDETGEESHADH